MREQQQELIAAMRANADFGVDYILGDTAQNILQAPPAPPAQNDKPANADNPAHADPPIAGIIAAIKQATESANKARNLDELQTALSDFTGCALQHTATNQVFYEGAHAPELLIIGDCPDAQEDREGKPFVGPAGILLNTILGHIGIDEQDTMRVHVVFWRPPGNRTPTKEEIKICQPFIHRLINLSAPRCILAMGQLAAASIWNEQTPINRLRGKWRTFATDDETTIPAILTFQPSALIGNATLKRACWADMLTLQGHLLERTP